MRFSGRQLVIALVGAVALSGCSLFDQSPPGANTPLVTVTTSTTTPSAFESRFPVQSDTDLDNLLRPRTPPSSRFPLPTEPELDLDPILHGTTTTMLFSTGR